MGSTPRALSLVGVALLLLYLILVISALWPVQLVVPAWQLRIGGQLINSAPVGLLGLALLHLASFLSPRDPLLRGRRRAASSLAVLAVLGFLLLVPLLATASLRQQQIQVAEQLRQVQRAEGQLSAFRQALAASATPEDLEQRFNALEGPRLDATDRSLPMEELEARVNALFDRLAAQIARQRALLPAADPRERLPEILRAGFGSLALALAFAALARRPGVEISLIEELQMGWHNTVQRLRLLLGLRVSGHGGQPEPDADYIRQLSDRSEPPDARHGP